MSKVLTDEQRKLVMDNEKLVWYFIKHKMNIPYQIQEDCYQEGMIGLMEAALRFDPSKGVSFGAFADKFIYGKIFAYSNTYNQTLSVPQYLAPTFAKYKKMVKNNYTQKEAKDELKLPDSLASAFYTNYTNSYLDVIGELGAQNKDRHFLAENKDAYEFIDDIDNCLSTIRKILSMCTERERDVYTYIITKKYKDEFQSFRALGKEMGVSASYLSEVYTKCSEILKTGRDKLGLE